MKNYAVLLAPNFCLQAALRYQPRSRVPIALVEQLGTKPQISEFNAEAEAFRIERGISPTQALARCPNLRLLSPNAGHERSVLEVLLQQAERLSPFFEITGKGIVTIELPEERNFSEEDVREKLISPLKALGLNVQVGIAGTPDLALLAAKFAQPVKIVAEPSGFMASLPVSTLLPTDEMAEVLDSWGVRSVEEFLALPQAQVWERLGPDAVRLGELATGGKTRPLRLIKAPEDFSEQTELEHPIELLEPLLFILRGSLEQITTRLGSAYLVADQIRLLLRFDQGEPHGRVFTIPHPTRDVDILFRMLHSHLESFRSEAPIIGVELSAKPKRPTAEQFDLLETGLRDPHQFAETLARLEGLLGSGGVGSPVIEGSHHPDAFHLGPYQPVTAKPSQVHLQWGVPWLRFRPPVPARVIWEGSRPAHLFSTQESGPIQDAAGPWLSEGGWWERKRWTREEWNIATDDAMYRLVRDGETWFLDGVYA